MLRAVYRNPCKIDLGTMPLTIRERSQRVAACIKTKSTQGIESIAAAIGISKSSVHRHQQAIARRNQYPESSLWETAAGSAWLLRLVVGVVYHFGIKHGVGAESLSAFFKAVQLDTHVGSSASALRQLKHRLQQAIVAYEAAQAEQCQPAPPPLASASGAMKPFLACRFWCWWS